VCLIAVAYRVHPDFPLVVAANRDEFYERPTAQAAFWEDQPAILAGRDLECMGTWLGVTRTGRFAAVTNYRDPSDLRTSAESRGTLVSRFLAQDDPAADFIDEVDANAGAYRGFNLLVYDSEELFYYSNRGAVRQRLAPGIYGLSNHLLDTPWPKVRLVRERLGAALAAEPATESLFALMADTSMAPEDELPQTGVGAEREKMLSAARIVSATYGTRCSSVLVQSGSGTVRFAERTYGPEGAELDTAGYEFRLAS
jgi:uncharacterized protein with NRDE domain